MEHQAPTFSSGGQATQLFAPGVAGLRAAGPLFSESDVHPRTILLLRVLNPLAFALVCVVNGLGASGVIGGKSQADVSNAHPTPITPA